MPVIFALRRPTVSAVSSGGGSTLTADLQASRTSGPAPLAVFFDAIGTTSTDGTVDTFGEVGYSFNFGEVGLGNWTHSGLSKNVQKGAATAAHVFETPGTYTVKVRARDSSGGTHNGDTHQTSITITVDDPDSTFSGTNTVCISRTSDTTGSPAGAQLLTSQSSWPTFASNKRYLLRAGQDFSSFGTLNIRNKTLMQVGSFGSGADAIVNVGVEAGNPTNYGHTTWSSRIALYDLQGAFSNDNSSTEVLLLRCTHTGLFDVGGSQGYYYGTADPVVVTDMQHTVLWFMVECDVSGGFNVFTIDGRSPVVMGCTLHDAGSEHVLRLWQNYKGFIAHNHIYGPQSGRHNLKSHSTGTQLWSGDLLSQTSTPCTQYFVVASNKFGNGSDPNDFPLTVGAQNNDGSPYIEGNQDVVFEGNSFTQDWATEINMGGRRMWERGNSNTTGSFNYFDPYNANGIPSGWDGPYSHSSTAITTSDPT